jgi:hypothetical protein
MSLDARAPTRVPSPSVSGRPDNAPRATRVTRPRRARFGTVSLLAEASAAALAALAVLGFWILVPHGSDPPLSLTSGSGFAITSAIYEFPACSGTTPLLMPGVTDCAVFTVTNHLTVPITVTNVSMAVTSSPAGCPAHDFSLPTFTGNLTVAGSSSASSTGQPISLLDTGANQNACQGATIGFAYGGSAQYTDSTSTTLAASPTSVASAQQPVTLEATVTGDNAASDSSLPTGTVAFSSCPTAVCSSSTALGTGTIGAAGIATLASDFSTGVHYVRAEYGGEGTDFAKSTSQVLTLTVGSPATSAGTGAGPGPIGGSTTPTRVATTAGGAIAFTGADIAGMVLGGLALIAAGTGLRVYVRRRRAPESTS